MFAWINVQQRGAISQTLTGTHDRWSQSLSRAQPTYSSSHLYFLARCSKPTHLLEIFSLSLNRSPNKICSVPSEVLQFQHKLASGDICQKGMRKKV